VRGREDALSSAEPRHSVADSIVRRAFPVSDSPSVSSIAGRYTAMRATPLHSPYDSLVTLSRAAVRARIDVPFPGANYSSPRRFASQHLHAARVHGLPALHQDPFDRMLVAQALVEPLMACRAARSA
jgi:hypothetical protein